MKKFVDWLWEFTNKNIEPKKNDSILNRVKKRNENKRSRSPSPEVEKKPKVDVNPEKVLIL